MNENDLKAILARNPAITTDDDYVTRSGYKHLSVTVSETPKDSGEIPPPVEERREEDALDEVVQGKTASQVRPIVRFVFYRTRLLDADARAHGCKDLLDGLVEAGILPGDREDQIDFDARQEKVHYKKDERTEIELTLP